MQDLPIFSEPPAADFGSKVVNQGSDHGRSLPPNIRGRLHVICALYAYTPCSQARLELLDRLEQLTLQAALALATELVEDEWQGWAIGAPGME
jgi:hypothetical protein